MAKKPPPFNNPFGGLKLEKPKPAAPAAAPPPATKKKAAPVTREDEDARLFLEAIGEVAPVKKGRDQAPRGPPPSADELVIPTEEAESLARLAELVAGEGPFELADGDEFIEGSVAGLDPRVLSKLRAGDFSHQAHVDLHGLTREEAHGRLERLLMQSRVAGHRCVLVIHGRGLHSKDQIPVLKASVREWLSRGRLARAVLAFCTAKPAHGGAGAVYVLLRR